MDDLNLSLCFVFGLVLTRCPLRWAGGLRIAQGARVRPVCPGMHVGDERHYVLSALLLMTFVSASSIFSMVVMGPCIFSCGTHVRRTLLFACCSSLIGLMRL